MELRLLKDIPYFDSLTTKSLNTTLTVIGPTIRYGVLSWSNFIKRLRKLQKSKRNDLDKIRSTYNTRKLWEAWPGKAMLPPYLSVFVF